MRTTRNKRKMKMMRMTTSSMAQLRSLRGRARKSKESQRRCQLNLQMTRRHRGGRESNRETKKRGKRRPRSRTIKSEMMQEAIQGMKAGVRVDKAVVGESRITGSDKTTVAIRVAVETEATVGTIVVDGVAAVTIGRETTSTTNTRSHLFLSRSEVVAAVDEVGAKTEARRRELSMGVTAKTIRGTTLTSMMITRRKIHLQGGIIPTTTAIENKKVQAKIREEVRVVDEEEAIRIGIITMKNTMGRRQGREAVVEEVEAIKEHTAVVGAEDATETRMAERIKLLRRQETKETKTE